MYVDEKKLEEKKNASSDVITSSLCLSRDLDLVGSTSDEFYRFQSVQTTGGCYSCGETNFSGYQ